MPFKYFQTRTHPVSHRYPERKRDWSTYNKRMKMRGDITIWLSTDVIQQWHVAERNYDGNGAPILYSDMAILTVHEIRQVFRLPLRQCEGFVNALFSLMQLDLRCPSFSTLSKRLRTLELTQPFYRLAHAGSQEVKAIAIDSTGLKCYGQDEWALEKYGKTRQRRDWRKLHITVDHHHIIQTSELTDRNKQDMDVVNNLIKQIKNNVNQITADAAYDANKIYLSLQKKFSNVDIVIPPKKGSTYNKKSEWMRNRNIEEIQCYGRLAWQIKHRYGNRNHSECAIGRYKRILGNKLHAREFKRQQQEAIIGCSILNKMMCITLAEIRPKN
jgi:Transposase DDE domain